MVIFSCHPKLTFSRLHGVHSSDWYRSGRKRWLLNFNLSIARYVQSRNFWPLSRRHALKTMRTIGGRPLTQPHHPGLAWQDSLRASDPSWLARTLCIFLIPPRFRFMSGMSCIHLLEGTAAGETADRKRQEAESAAPGRILISSLKGPRTQTNLNYTPASFHVTSGFSRNSSFFRSRPTLTKSVGQNLHFIKTTFVPLL